MRTTAFLLILGLSISCRPTKYIYHPPYDKPNSAGAESNILAMTFKIADDRDKSVITLISSTVSNGFIKQITVASTSSYRLEARLEDGNGKILVTQAFDHPLFKSSEFVNDKNELERKRTTVPESEFFLRLSLPADASKLTIEEYRENKSVGTSQFNVR